MIRRILAFPRHCSCPLRKNGVTVRRLLQKLADDVLVCRTRYGAYTPSLFFFFYEQHERERYMNNVNSVNGRANKRSRDHSVKLFPLFTLFTSFTAFTLGRVLLGNFRARPSPAPSLTRLGSLSPHN